eukprot:TRINITY_DN75265_c0_g1_i1.p1 TRINITY_DN75265_c0_g1~~TRINITY_DN75265_c0_g1_i1.p1  ORF type:complete len:246 (-),score=32.26 TRINITY_DN75265_c0_g1_i1:34-771(-)
MPVFRFAHGDRVATNAPTVGDVLHGTVRFIGPVGFDASGEWVGVELDEAVGNSDGSVHGVWYFTCKPKRGIFVKPTALRRTNSTSRRRLQRNDSRARPGDAAYFGGTAVAVPVRPISRPAKTSRSPRQIHRPRSVPARHAGVVEIHAVDEALVKPGGHARLALLEAMDAFDVEGVRKWLPTAAAFGLPLYELDAAKQMLANEVVVLPVGYYERKVILPRSRAYTPWHGPTIAVDRDQRLPIAVYV